MTLSRSPVARAVIVGALALAGGGACSGSTYSLGTDCLPSGTGRELQEAIDTRARVLLCPGAVLTLGAPLVLRQGLRLETAHRPANPSEMATIVFGPELSSSQLGVITSGSDIQIANVRFDGNRRTLGARDPMALVRLGPGRGYEVTGSVFTETPGWTHLHLWEPCSDARIIGNVVEAAPRANDDTGHEADGFSISCSQARIEDNQIADISGVGIVYFGGPGTTIRNNRIELQVSSAYSGINLGDAVQLDHAGVVVERNQVIATGARYFRIGIAGGLHPWKDRTKQIRGVTIRDNLISGIARYSLAVDGCVDCLVIDNRITDWRPLPVAPGCPDPAPYVASVSNGHAGGTLQPGYVDANLDGCLGPAVSQ